MVSSKTIALFTFATALPLGAQLGNSPLSVEPTNSFRPTPSVPESSLTPPKTKPALSPEQRGDILMARKMFREAVETYREEESLTPITINKIGIAYHQMLELDLAKKHYERAIKLNPDYAEALNNLGTVHYAKKRYGRAISQYRKALKITPRSASMLSNLGTAFFAQRKYKEAAEAYQEALAIDPEVFEHRGQGGSLLQERSVTERAKFHFYLAKTYAKAGMQERALLYLRKALEEGYKERAKIPEEPEFAELRETAAFKELMAADLRVL